MSTVMLAMWAVSGPFLGAYLAVENANIPLLVQPQAFCLLACICVVQYLYYDRQWPLKVAIAAVAAFLASSAFLMRRSLQQSR